MTAFSRSAALLGDDAMSRLAAARVLVVGVGGVGSWCAEALVRTGVGAVTLVDDDRVAESNVNRQCPATSKTIGLPKVEVMRERLLEINPKCRVEARFERFTGFGVKPDVGFSRVEHVERVDALCGQGNVFLGGADDFDVVVDAIDSVDCKAELILGATGRGIPLVSSMGAALRTDPAKVRAVRFDKVEGDGLARALRQRFKKLGRHPAAKFTCVCSAEPPKSLGASAEKGSLMQVTAVFGMCLAAETVKCIVGERGNRQERFSGGSAVGR